MSKRSVRFLHFVKTSLLVTGIVLGLAVEGGAQTAAKVPQAQQLVAAGVASLAAGNADKALVTLEQAYRAAPLPEILYQLGRVAQAQGRTVAAADLCRRYLDSAVEPTDAAAVEVCTKYLRDNKSLTATVTVTAEQGALLIVDGRVSGVLPLVAPLLLSPGAHRFRLEVGSRSYESDAIEVPAGRQAELHLTPGAGRTAVAVLSLPPVVAVLLAPGGVPAGTSEPIHRAMTEAAQKQHVLVVPRDKLATALPQPVATCLRAPTCLRTLGERTQAATILLLQLEPKGQGGYQLRGQLVDAATGEEAAAVAESCSGCDGARVIDPVRVLTTHLLDQGLARPRGTLEVTSTPPGAQVQLEGRPVGVTPLSQAVFIGDRDLRITRPGFVPLHAVLPVVAGQNASLDVQLVPERGQKSP